MPTTTQIEVPTSLPAPQPPQGDSVTHLILATAALIKVIALLIAIFRKPPER